MKDRLVVGSEFKVLGSGFTVDRYLKRSLLSVHRSPMKQVECRSQKVEDGRRETGAKLVFRCPFTVDRTNRIQGLEDKFVVC